MLPQMASTNNNAVKNMLVIQRFINVHLLQGAKGLMPAGNVAVNLPGGTLGSQEFLLVLPWHVVDPLFRANIVAIHGII